MNKALPSEKPLPAIPPGAIPANDVHETAAHSIIDAEELPLRRPVPGNPNIQEEWPALLPLNANTLSRAESKQVSTDFQKSLLVPGPSRSGSTSTVSSLVNFYENGIRASYHSASINNWNFGLQDHTRRASATSSTSTTENLCSGSRHTIPPCADSQNLNPFAKFVSLEHKGLGFQRASEPVHSVTRAGLGQSHVFSASLNTSIRPQTRNPFLDPQTSQLLATNTSVLLQPNPGTCQRPAVSALSLSLPYSFKPKMDTSPTENMELHPDNRKPQDLKDQIQAAQTSQDTPSHQQTARIVDLPVERSCSDSAGVSAVGSLTASVEQNDNTQSRARPHSDRRSSRIPRASLRVSLVQIENPSKTLKNKYSSPERPSSIPVPIRSLSLRNTPSRDEVVSSPSVSNKGKETDMLADPIPENENAALTPPVLPQKAYEPAAAQSESSDEEGFMGEDEVPELERPPTVYTGEYRVKRLSRVRPDQGPILRISASAEEVIMGKEENESHTVSKQEAGQQSRASITESFRASIESRMSSVSMKRASLRSASLNAQEAANSGTRYAVATNGEKTKSQNAGESPSSRRPRSQTSPEHGTKRDISAKEMNIFRRLANNSSFSSLRAETLIPDDAPPVPKIPAHLAMANKVNLVPTNQKILSGESSTVMTTPQSTPPGGSFHYMSGARGDLPKGSVRNVTPGSISELGQYKDRTTEADKTPSKFPPRTTSHKSIPNHVFDAEPRPVHTAASEPDLKHSKASLRSRGNIKFPSKRKDTYPTGTGNTVSSPVGSRPSGLKGSRVLENLRGFFGRQKGTMEKGTAAKDDNAKVPKIKQADKKTEETKNSKGFKGTPGAEKVNLRKGARHFRFSKGGRSDDTTEKADVNGGTPAMPKPVPSSRATSVPVPGPVRDRAQGRIPSFARPTQATLTRAAANARTPATPTSTTTFGARVSRATRGPTVTATGSPLGLPRVQPRTLTTNMGQMNRPFSESQPSVSPSPQFLRATGRSSEPSSNSPFLPCSAAAPLTSASLETQNLEEIRVFISEVQKRAQDEINFEKREKLLGVSRSSADSIPFLSCFQQPTNARMQLASFFMEALSYYNEMEKDLHEAYLLLLERQVDLAIAKKNIFQSFRDTQKEWGVNGQQEDPATPSPTFV